MIVNLTQDPATCRPDTGRPGDTALEILTHIVAEYDQTYDGEVRGGYWLGAASIPVELMQRAKALVSNQSEDPCR